jgi:ABC-type transporter Mla subunit MlaD
MNSQRLVGLVVVLGVSVLVGLLVMNQKKTTEIQVVFKDGKNLRPGSQVLLSGLGIGNVVKVDRKNERFVATLQIERERFDELNESAVACIRTKSHVTGEKYIDLCVPKTSATPLKSGDTIEGAGNYLLWKARCKGLYVDFEKIAENLSFKFRDIQDRVSNTDWSTLQPQLRRDWEAVQRQLEEVLAKGKESFAENLEAVGQSLDELQQKLRDASEGEDAQNLYQALQDLRERIERELQ